LEVDAAEDLGRALTLLGVYDLPMSEVVWRLMPKGGAALDVGANLGYVTSLLVARGGPGSRVSAFEPHPLLFAQLRHNATGWRASSTSTVELIQAAVSDTAGEQALLIPHDFDQNAGLPSLDNAAHKLTSKACERIPVRTITLDDYVGDTTYDLMKVDVEGAELNVLRGAGGLLTNGRIRDIVYEDHSGANSSVRAFLKDAGYDVFRIQRSFFGPRLLPGDTSGKQVWEPPNFLATRDAARAQRCLAPCGWDVLRPLT
jgi:FkbM family methyltransferase